MSNYTQSVNNRISFSRDKYHSIIKKWNRTKSGDLLEFVSGYNARKLNQAYKIYCHYVFIATGAYQNPTCKLYN